MFGRGTTQHQQNRWSFEVHQNTSRFQMHMNVKASGQGLSSGRIIDPEDATSRVATLISNNALLGSSDSYFIC